MIQPSAPSPVEIAGWLGCLFFLVAGWNQLERFLDRRTNRAHPRTIHPQPLRVESCDTSVAETLCRARRQELSAELHRQHQELGDLRQERQAEAADVRQKINKVDRELGELRACLEANTRQLAGIDAKLDRVIERNPHP